MVWIAVIEGRARNHSAGGSAIQQNPNLLAGWIPVRFIAMLKDLANAPPQFDIAQSIGDVSMQHAVLRPGPTAGVLFW